MKYFTKSFLCYQQGNKSLNAVSCLAEDGFRLQQENVIKTEYRKIDPNRSWEVKTDSQVFLINGRAEIKYVFG